ncbi:FAD binding domain protein [Aspergillus spinulosporus]
MKSFLPGSLVLLALGFAESVLSNPRPNASITAIGTVNLETGADCACSQLASSYPNQILFPDSVNYTTQAINYWDIRADLLPACIYLPTSADQVAAAYPGSNNIDGGVLLALDSMKDYKVDNETITVSPGMTWYDVYSALEPYGRVAIGGRLKTIGVPGLTLIGGVSYFSNKYGFAMDNVVDYEVVLGNGTKIVASATSHPDLFWALKGGANNFAVVTRFRLKTFSMPYISTTIQQFSETGIYDFVRASCDLVLADDASTAAGVVLTITYNVTTSQASASILGVQEGTSSPPSQFANFTAIPGTSKIHNVTTSKQWASNLDSPKQIIVFGHHSMYPDAEVLYSMFETWKAAVAQIADIQDLYPTFVINLSPASAASVAKTNHIGNTWGLSEEPLIWWQVTTGWDRAEDSLRVEAWVRHLVEHLHANNKRNGLAREFIYMGDAGEWQDPFVGFPPENVQRMRDIRQIYDPTGTFSRLNWGGFKLGY